METSSGCLLKGLRSVGRGFPGRTGLNTNAGWVFPRSVRRSSSKPGRGPAPLFSRARMLSCSWGVNDNPAIFAAASSISRVMRGASCATAINAPGINARLPAEKHSRNRRRFSASVSSSIAQETSAGLRLAGGTRVDFYIDVDGREQRRVTGNRTNPVVTGDTETHLRFRCDGFSVNRRADIRIELYLAWSSIKNPPDPHTFYASSDLAISGTVSATKVWQSIIRDRDPQRDRKSTRLNSSHRCISYAVFCLKKKMAAITAS